MYKICIATNCYMNAQEINNYAFRFLIKDQNECLVESLMGAVDDVVILVRNSLSYDTAIKIIFVKRNVPTPFSSQELRKKLLDDMFDVKWHFLSWRETWSSVLIKETNSAR